MNLDYGLGAWPQLPFHVSSCGQRRRGCRVWFESSFGAQVSRYVFSRCGSFNQRHVADVYPTVSLRWFLIMNLLRSVALILNDNNKITFCRKTTAIPNVIRKHLSSVYLKWHLENSPYVTSKLGLLLEERICSPREQILSSKSGPYDKGW